MPIQINSLHTNSFQISMPQDSSNITPDWWGTGYYDVSKDSTHCLNLAYDAESDTYGGTYSMSILTVGRTQVSAFYLRNTNKVTQELDSPQKEFTFNGMEYQWKSE